MLQDIVNKVSRQDFSQQHFNTDELDKLYDLIEDYTRLQGSAHQRKKLLVLRWVTGLGKLSNSSEILLYPDSEITFGSGENCDVRIAGDRICSLHFRIKYHKEGLRLINLNLNEGESCGVYKRLLDEPFQLKPGNAFRIGTLEFVVERFNTGIVSDIGQRQSMEDTFSAI